MSITTTNNRSLRKRIFLTFMLPVSLILTLLFNASFDTPMAHAGLNENCPRIREQMRSATIELGVVIVDLVNEARCESGAQTIFRTASLYKLLVMAEAYEQEAAGTFTFDEEIELLPRHYIDDLPDTIPADPLTLTAQIAMQLMIQQSDNATAHALRERLTHREIAAHAAQLGMTQTVLSGAFITSPADIAIFFELLYAGKIVSPEASTEMLMLLGGQEIRDLLPQGLPAGRPIAHKTGLLKEYLHDAGIVHTASGDYVIVVLSHHGGDYVDYLAASETIHGLSALVYESFTSVTDPLAIVPPAEGSIAADNTGLGSTATATATATAAGEKTSNNGVRTLASPTIENVTSDPENPWWNQSTRLWLLVVLAVLGVIVAGITFNTDSVTTRLKRNRHIQ